MPREAKGKADFISGIRSGVNGTPTFFINGRRIEGDWTDRQAFAAALETAAGQERWRSGLTTTREQLVSSDIIGDPHAAIVDLSLTKVVDGDLCSAYSWRDVQSDTGVIHRMKNGRSN